MQLTYYVSYQNSLRKTHKSILLWETFFACFGVRGLHKNISQISATIDFLSGEIAGKTLSVRKNLKGTINLGQTSRLKLEQIWHQQ